MLAVKPPNTKITPTLQQIADRLGCKIDTPQALIPIAEQMIANGDTPILLYDTTVDLFENNGLLGKILTLHVYSNINHYRMVETFLFFIQFNLYIPHSTQNDTVDS